MVSLLLTLANMPTPPGAFPAGLPPMASPLQRERAEKLLATRNAVFGAHRHDGDGDAEDFWEMAARLSAAMESEADEVWHALSTVERLRGSMPSSRSLEERLTLPRSHREAMVPYGPIPKNSFLWFTLASESVDGYGRWPVFQTRAGRATQLCGIDVEPDAELSTAISSWVRRGIVEEGEAVIVKASRAKHGLWRLPASGDEERCREAITHALGWATVSLGENPTGFLLQKQVIMTHEYRMFIVDGKPVTGAGCVEEYTPLWNRGEVFDARTRRLRSPYFVESEDELLADAPGEEAPRPPRTPVVESKELVRRYQEAAEHIAQRMPRPTAVIDLAYLEQEDQVIMVEANGLSNAGLYASDPSLVTAALVTNSR